MNINVSVSLNAKGLFLGLTIPINYFDHIKTKTIIGFDCHDEEVHIKTVEHDGVIMVFTRGET